MKEWGCGDLIPVCMLPLTQVWTPMGTALLLLIFLKGMHLEIQRQENVFLLWEEGSIGSSGIRGGKRDESSVKNAKQTTQALSILRPPSSPKCLRWEEKKKKKSPWATGKVRIERRGAALGAGDRQASKHTTMVYLEIIINSLSWMEQNPNNQRSVPGSMTVGLCTQGSFKI